MAHVFSCVPAMVLFPLVITTISEGTLVLHHWNQNESLRLFRSARSKNSLDFSVVSCYGSQCVLNEQYCDATLRKCAMCHYENGECTANSDCFNFCSEKKAQEICTGQEGHTENTAIPWWTYLLLVLFIASIVANVYCIIKTYKMWKKRRGHSEPGATDPDDNHDLEPNPNVDIENVPMIHNEIEDSAKPSSESFEPIIAQPESVYSQSPSGPQHI
ncbi:hypothetical protein ACJMK2_023986 [Sinanodonta woodiana]|uniref:Uncharacterized protein n=1 Tax=Sinanodonta woodiana TaxID=1069815 RepID=A0ABD3T5X9_SINWO